MTHYSYRHRGGSSSRRAFTSVFAVLAVCFGAWFVYQAIGWFRTSNEVRQETQEEADETSHVAEVALPFESTAVLLGIDGSSKGMAYRQGTVEVPSFSLTVTLPPLLENTTYGIWMVKDGLADVRFVGALTPRADGSFVQTFSMKDPLQYPNLVIMTEKNDGNDTPSGDIVAQGRFE